MEALKVIVVGGGASGLMAAYAAASEGADVLLIEKNEKLGKKIYITGKGRCNVTNDCAPDVFLEHVVRGKKFLTGCIWSFPSEKLMELLSEHGLPLKTERGNRVFPVSDHASDVTKTLEKMCREAGVHIHLQEKMLKIVAEHSIVSGIITDKAEYSCDRLIVATGGLSYPSTGSTGDGHAEAERLGHTLTPCVPSLVGMNAKGMSSLQGLSLKNVVLSAERAGKTIFSELGELLFTHYGISGPLVLTLSACVNRMPLQEVTLYLDLKPALDEGALARRLLRDFATRCNEQMKNVMRGLLPAGLSFAVLERAGIPPTKQANSVTKAERAALIMALKRFTIRPESLRGFGEAVITSGGVSLSEVDPKTMRSKLFAGLYFCGELLDVDAYTGGFNLQIAFSTGYAAGRAAAKKIC